MKKINIIILVIIVFACTVNAEERSLEALMRDAFFENRTMHRFRRGASLPTQYWHQLVHTSNVPGLVFEPLSYSPQGFESLIGLRGLGVSDILTIGIIGSAGFAGIESMYIHGGAGRPAWYEGYYPPPVFFYEGAASIELFGLIGFRVSVGKACDVRNLPEDSLSPYLKKLVSAYYPESDDPMTMELWDLIWPRLETKTLSYINFQGDIYGLDKFVHRLLNLDVRTGRLFNLSKLRIKLFSDISSTGVLENAGVLYNTGISFLPLVQIRRSELFDDTLIRILAEVPSSWGAWIRPVTELEYAIGANTITSAKAVIDFFPLILQLLTAPLSGDDTSISWNTTFSDTKQMMEGLGAGVFRFSVFGGPCINYEHLSEDISMKIFPLYYDTTGGIPKGLSFGSNVMLSLFFTTKNRKGITKLTGMNIENSFMIGESQRMKAVLQFSYFFSF